MAVTAAATPDANEHSTVRVVQSHGEPTALFVEPDVAVLDGWYAFRRELSRYQTRHLDGALTVGGAGCSQLPNYATTPTVTVRRLLMNSRIRLCLLPAPTSSSSARWSRMSIICSNEAWNSVCG